MQRCQSLLDGCVCMFYVFYTEIRPSMDPSSCRMNLCCCHSCKTFDRIDATRSVSFDLLHSVWYPSSSSASPLIDWFYSGLICFSPVTFQIIQQFRLSYLKWRKIIKNSKMWCGTHLDEKQSVWIRMIGWINSLHLFIYLLFLLALILSILQPLGLDWLTQVEDSYWFLTCWRECWRRANMEESIFYVFFLHFLCLLK